MGALLDLDAARRRRRQPARHAGPRFYVDLADPVSHRLVEGMERQTRIVRLRVASAGLVGGQEPASLAPVVRAAAHAVACGRGNRFLVAALRMAHGGGYDLRGPEVLLEAAAVAGIPFDAALAAARDPRWEAPVRLTSSLLRGAGVAQVPALQIGGRFVCGEGPIATWFAVGGPAPQARIRS